MSDIAEICLAPLLLWRGSVHRDWLDYNGHMTEHRYLQVFGEASDCLYGLLGVNFEQASEGAFYTLQTHLVHMVECGEGTILHVETELLGYDEKRLHLFHRLLDGSGRLMATGEHLAIHVRHSAVSPASPIVIHRIGDMFHAQRARATPPGTGSVLKRPLAFARAAENV